MKLPSTTIWLSALILWLTATWPCTGQLPFQPERLPPLGQPAAPLEAPLVTEPDQPLEGIATEPDQGWILPYDWFATVDWDGGVELGLSGTDGNAESLSLRAGADLKRTTDIYEIGTDFTYLKASASGEETQHSAQLNTKYEYFFGESAWSYFLKNSLEYDEFKAFDLRIVLNGGVGYKFIRTDTVTLSGRLGAGASHEIHSPDNRWLPEAVFGADYEWKISDRQKVELQADYFPSWEDFNDYRLVTDFGWEILLDEAANLSLKLSVNDRYDSTPNGRRPNDVDYAILLLWTF